MNDKPELLHCPFCGGKPKVLSAVFMEVCCGNDGCVISFFTMSMDSWNRRVTAPNVKDNPIPQPQPQRRDRP